jgi:hypothetical protein
LFFLLFARLINSLNRRAAFIQTINSSLLDIISSKKNRYLYSFLEQVGKRLFKNHLTNDCGEKPNIFFQQSYYISQKKENDPTNNSLIVNVQVS